MSQTSYAITTKTFNSLQEMKNSTELSIGMVCETLGYYVKGDGGGARYTVEAKGDETANDMDIIAIGGNNGSLIARYLYEGKPVNVLQFGAINTYTTERPGTDPYEVDENGVSPDTRDDQPAIQRAIDYTHDRLTTHENAKIYVVENKEKKIQDVDCYKNAINTVIIPEGNYVIKKQIKMPPYMQFYLTGDVQFFSVIKDFGDTSVYSLKNKDGETGNSDLEFEPINSFGDVPSKKEIFAKNDFYDGAKKLKLSTSTKEEYNVYKHGTIKICYKLKPDGTPDTPYITENGERYAVGTVMNKDIFCGNGTLTIKNNAEIAEKNGEETTYSNPYYTCAIEIGSTEENIRYYAEGSTVKGKQYNYENLRFKNLKIRGFHIGMLQHGHSFYSNVISNIEFWDNDIAFQLGVYGEEETMGNGYIIREKGIECGEMNHFRDCLFTSNKISVNMMLSGCNAYFTDCHFDFDNCMFRAAYRSTITVDKCHIEGIGKDLRQKFLASDEEMQNGLFVMTREKLNDFNSRAESDPLNEFAGIMYAKPVTKFGGSQAAQYSYVQLSIINSRIVDNEYLPCGMFSFYNQGEATDCDGHYRSNLYLNNNTYGSGSYYPISYLTSKTDGIVQSGFLLSEFPEVDQVSNDVADERRFEKFACQNVPVQSSNSKDFGTYSSHLKPRGNHRFLSNRTLANKYPYFQNVVTYDMTGYFRGATAFLENSTSDYNIEDNVSIVSGIPLNQPMKRFDSSAKCFEFNVPILGNTQENANDVQTRVCFKLEGDMVECKKGDTLAAALVTNIVPYSKTSEGEDHSTFAYKPAKHSIAFTEYDVSGTILGSYEYDVPHNIDSDMNTYKNYCVKNFPSTSACKHKVCNKTTDKVMLTLKIAIPKKYGSLASDEDDYFTLNAVLVEKNL